MYDEAFSAESERRRSAAVDVVEAIAAEYAGTRCRRLPNTAAFRPAVVVERHERLVASVSAHALGCSVLVGPKEELIALDDLAFEEALVRVEEILRASLEME